MSGPVSIAAKHLMAAGVTGDLLVAALSEIEASLQPAKTEVSAEALRMRKYREHRKANGLNPNKPEYLEHVATVKQRDEHKCIYCGNENELVIDHMIPICQGGTDDIDNLGTACRPCNGAKSGRTVEQWGRAIIGENARCALLRYVATRTNSDTLPSPLPPSFSPTPPITTPITPTIPENISREASKNKRGTRLSDEFEPDAGCYELAEKLLLSTVETQNAFDNFMDYWRAVPGAKGLKLDWQATFRNQLRHVAKGKKNGKDSTNTIKGGFDVIDSALKQFAKRELGVRNGDSEADTQDVPRLHQVAS